RRHRNTEQRDEFAPSHCLTQGARQGIVAGPTGMLEVAKSGSVMSALGQKRTCTASLKYLVGAAARDRRPARDIYSS
ncbi:MAG TPA: hypothetical protein VM822_20980, partial [Pseudolabrys sp.]|nr:hypothetical protein [Pseudolabrys sp.]